MSTRTNSLTRKAVRIEVALLRTPLLAADQLAARVGAGAAVRSTVQRGIAVLDAVAERVAGGPADAPTAAPSGVPSEAKPRRSERPEPVAPDAPAAPGDSAPTDSSAAVDGEELVEHVAEELLEEQEVAPLAGELAEDEELRRVQAELNARRLVAEQQDQRPD